MWKLKIEFETLSEVGDFINKIHPIEKTEYHIDAPNNQIVITCENEYCKELILQTLAEYIVNNYKTQYFQRYLKLDFLPSVQTQMLIKVLVMFDIESDIYYVLNGIEKLKYINVQSYDAFILRKIKHKWEEFALITNLNGAYLLNYDVFIEFLKFLISSIQPKNKAITLKSDVKKFLLFDAEDNLINSGVDLNDEMGLIANLVLLAPQNINIYCSDQVSEKTFKTLYYLFDKKINLRV